MLDLCNPNSSTIREALKQLKSPIIVGVAGDSGSGKTTLATGFGSTLVLEPFPETRLLAQLMGSGIENDADASGSPASN